MLDVVCVCVCACTCVSVLQTVIHLHCFLLLPSASQKSLTGNCICKLLTHGCATGAHGGVRECRETIAVTCNATDEHKMAYFTNLLSTTGYYMDSGRQEDHKSDVKVGTYFWLSQVSALRVEQLVQHISDGDLASSWRNACKVIACF